MSRTPPPRSPSYGPPPCPFPDRTIRTAVAGDISSLALLYAAALKIGSENEQGDALGFAEGCIRDFIRVLDSEVKP